MKLGIFGGTFNPIHMGHLYIAEQTCKRLPLDRVMFLPSGDPPHKPAETLAPAPHRLEMVRQAIENQEQFVLSDFEIHAQDKSYSIDTMQHFKKTLKEELWFMVGLDAFQDIPSWKSAEELLVTTNFAVISRPGHSFTHMTSIPFLPPIAPSTLQALEEGTLDRLDVSTSNTTTLTILCLPPCHISASAIRDHLRAGKDVIDWLPPGIESYIIQHHLYGAQERDSSSKT